MNEPQTKFVQLVNSDFCIMGPDCGSNAGNRKDFGYAPAFAGRKLVTIRNPGLLDVFTADPAKGFAVIQRADLDFFFYQPVHLSLLVDAECERLGVGCCLNGTA